MFIALGTDCRLLVTTCYAGIGSHLRAKESTVHSWHPIMSLKSFRVEIEAQGLR